MQHTGLNEDFENIRTTQTYAVGKVIDEAQNYIDFLEGKLNAFEALCAYLNTLDDSKLNETKAEILAGAMKVLSEAGIA